MKKMIFSLAMLFICGTTFGQEAAGSITDSELNQFAETLTMVQTINQQSQQQMLNAVQKKGLDAQRYTEIQQAQQSADVDAKASDDEMKKFSEASQEIQQIQVQAQQQMQSSIAEKSDLSLERYQEILAMVQQDAELQGRLEKQLQK